MSREKFSFIFKNHITSLLYFTLKNLNVFRLAKSFLFIFINNFSLIILPCIICFFSFENFVCCQSSLHPSFNFFISLLANFLPYSFLLFLHLVNSFLFLLIFLQLQLKVKFNLFFLIIFLSKKPIVYFKVRSLEELN